MFLIWTYMFAISECDLAFKVLVFVNGVLLFPM